MHTSRNIDIELPGVKLDVPSLSVIVTVAVAVVTMTKGSSVDIWTVKFSVTSNKLSSITTTLKQNSSPAANPLMVRERGVVDV